VGVFASLSPFTALHAFDNLKSKLKAAFKKKAEKLVAPPAEGASAPATEAPTTTAPPAATEPTKTDTAPAPASAPAGESFSALVASKAIVSA